MINYFLIVKNDPAIWRPIGIFCLAILIIFWIAGKVRELSREKLENEDIKEDYLKERFRNETNDLKDDEFSAEIEITKPYTRNKPWEIYKVTDRGYQGAGSFKSQYKSTLLLSILDSELDELIKSSN